MVSVGDKSRVAWRGEEHEAIHRSVRIGSRRSRTLRSAPAPAAARVVAILQPHPRHKLRRQRQGQRRSCHLCQVRFYVDGHANSAENFDLQYSN
jgi:hypothetical protein